jgi:hypothetical protein
VGEQFYQILAEIIIIVMDVFQEKEQPFQEVYQMLTK